ncbi:transposase, partial [Glycocaulis abyssi]
PGRPPDQPREWCHDLEYRADSWPAPRRVVLVVQERPDDLLLHAFFLVTNLSRYHWPPEKVLSLYRKRGSAEAHMGEVKSALDVHLSSTDRGASTEQNVMDHNEASLLLSLYAYQVLHGLRCVLERQTRQGWSLIRMCEQVLKVAATLILHARRITVPLGAAADKWWPTLLKGLPKLTALRCRPSGRISKRVRRRSCR